MHKEKEMKFEIDFYKKDNGDCPIIEFLDSLDLKMRAKVLRSIELLENNGNGLGMPYSEHLSDGIFELRTILGKNITRVLYFFVVGQKIILTNGFVKKTQKTPPQEIETAKKYRELYMNKMKGE